MLMDWFKEKSLTGNHGFSQETWVFPGICPFFQAIEWLSYPLEKYMT